MNLLKIKLFFLIYLCLLCSNAFAQNPGFFEGTDYDTATAVAYRYKLITVDLDGVYSSSVNYTGQSNGFIIFGSDTTKKPILLLPGLNIFPGISGSSIYIKGSGMTTISSRRGFGVGQLYGSTVKYDSVLSVYALALDSADGAYQAAMKNVTDSHFVRESDFTPVTISASNIDWSLGFTFTKSISSNATFTMSNLVDGKPINVIVTNTGSYTVSWTNPASHTIKWSNDTAPTQTTGNKTDAYSFLKVGNIILGSAIQNFNF